MASAHEKAVSAPLVAKDLMTREVVCVAPDTPTREVARRLASRSISAAPVVDARGAPIGMVSEGDLIGRDDDARRERRDWWLALLGGEVEAPRFLDRLRSERKAKDVMSAPVVTVTEATAAAEIARLLTSHRIKRVPVVRDGRIVGIVSRADLLRCVGVAAAGAHPDHEGLFARAARSIHRRFVDSAHAAAAPAAERGEKEMLLLRFPAQLCADRGRAINVPDPDWPATLRGEAAELYLRWENELVPRGFHLSARILDFPGGLPGDVGLFLVWDV